MKENISADTFPVFSSTDDVVAEWDLAGGTADDDADRPVPGHGVDAAADEPRGVAALGPRHGCLGRRLHRHHVRRGPGRGCKSCCLLAIKQYPPRTNPRNLDGFYCGEGGVKQNSRQA